MNKYKGRKLCLQWFNDFNTSLYSPSVLCMEWMGEKGGFCDLLPLLIEICSINKQTNKQPPPRKQNIIYLLVLYQSRHSPTTYITVG